MTRSGTLVLPQALALRLHSHLFPGDELEAAALLLCTEVRGQRTKWLARDLRVVPHGACARTATSITWSGEEVEAAMDAAERHGDCVFAVHSHPGGLFAFSDVDDDSDRSLIPALWHGTNRTCGSALMIPGGAIRARVCEDGQRCRPVEFVIAAGPNIRLCWHAEPPGAPPLAFSSGMRNWLQRLSACIIGVSGTGSIVAEQLARLGLGEIILIDFDRVERRNLNRILNTGIGDCGRPKTDVIAEAIHRHHPDCRVIVVPHAIGTREGVFAAADADLLFSCVDSAEGRHVADRLAASLCIPLFDLGVTIPTAMTHLGPRIAEVCGRIDYVFPSGSNLIDRDVYDGALLEAEYLARAAPDVHAKRLEEGYIRGIAEEAPAVLPVNMRAASACVLEFLSRLFPFRERVNEEYARTVFMLAEGAEDTYAESYFPAQHAYPLATGLAEPLLGLPSLGMRRRAA